MAEHTYIIEMRTSFTEKRANMSLAITGNLDDPWTRDELHCLLDTIIESFKPIARNYLNEDAA